MKLFCSFWGSSKNVNPNNLNRYFYSPVKYGFHLVAILQLLLESQKKRREKRQNAPFEPHSFDIIRFSLFSIYIEIVFLCSEEREKNDELMRTNVICTGAQCFKITHDMFRSDITNPQRQIYMRFWWRL